MTTQPTERRFDDAADLLETIETDLRWHDDDDGADLVGMYKHLLRWHSKSARSGSLALQKQRLPLTDLVSDWYFWERATTAPSET